MTIELHQYTRNTIRSKIVEIINLSNVQLDIFKGTMPTDVSSFDPSTHSANLLASFTTTVISTDIVNDTGVKMIRLTDYPSRTVGGAGEWSVTAVGSGTATWYALYGISDTTRAVLGDVSDEVGFGSLQLDSKILTLGGPVIISGFNIRRAQGSHGWRGCGRRRGGRRGAAAR